ncbi:MAG: hypothetical protein ACFFCW_22280, partial [Candidatus Hodarchaeota archaeon]
MRFPWGHRSLMSEPGYASFRTTSTAIQKLTAYLDGNISYAPTTVGTLKALLGAMARRVKWFQDNMVVLKIYRWRS